MAMKTKLPTPRLGSIISGTLREEDLIPAFADELRRISTDYSALCDDAEEIDFNEPHEDEAAQDLFCDHCASILERLQDALNELAPDYAYFGAHPGDGADFGFWLYEDAAQMIRDDGGLVVSDLSEVPDDYEGQVLEINDHGNATLYSVVSGQRREIWAVV